MKRLIRRFPALLALVALCAVLSSTAHAQEVIVGPGNTSIDSQDTQFDVIVVDLNNPELFAAGTWMASLFNYEFSNLFPQTAGTVTPVLLTGDGVSNFTPIAVGDPVPFTGATGFTSTSFGGQDTFVLGSATTVYAGLYWDGTNQGDRMPVGFLDGSGSSFVRFSTDTTSDPGANPPIVGVPISGGDSGIFPRTYDFSVTVIPEPSTIGLLGIGALGLIGYACRRRRS